MTAIGTTLFGRRRAIYKDEDGHWYETPVPVSLSKGVTKIQARSVINNAKRDGKLDPPEKCSRCGGAGPLDAHHPDHTKASEIQWLCKACHGEVGVNKHEVNPMSDRSTLDGAIAAIAKAEQQPGESLADATSRVLDENIVARSIYANREYASPSMRPSGVAKAQYAAKVRKAGADQLAKMARQRRTRDGLASDADAMVALLADTPAAAELYAVTHGAGSGA